MGRVALGRLSQESERVVRADRSRAGQGADNDDGAGRPSSRAAECRAAGRGSAPPNPQASGLWRSNDKGRTWAFVSNENQRPMYFSQLRVDPNDCETLYVGGVGPTKSTDGGKTWTGLNNMGHVDNHAIWIDPTNSRHVMYGNDWRRRRVARRRCDVGSDSAGSEWARLSRVGGHAATVLCMRRPAGQWLVVRTELRSERRAARRWDAPVDVDTRRRR
jgi:hypothetical protein